MGNDTRAALRFLRTPVCLMENAGQVVAGSVDSLIQGNSATGTRETHLRGYAPAILPEALGDPAFCSGLGIRYPYLGGSMAKGISSITMVEELGKAGMLGFFGAAGLPFATV